LTIRFDRLSYVNSKNAIINNNNINMRHVGIQKTSMGTLRKTVDVDYYVPRKGDTLKLWGVRVKLTKDLRPRIKVGWDGEKYVGSIMRTNDGLDKVVFAGGDGLGWRQGEPYEKQS